MTAKKIIAIVGATGSQGGSLARAILREGDASEFSVKAITRHVDSEKSHELARLGAQVVYGDINDETSITKAIEGAYGLYCVTLCSSEYYSPEIEIKQAANMSKAAKSVGVKHVIWSTMEDTRVMVPLDSNVMPTLFGRYKVPQCDCKAECDDFFADLPVTYMLPPFFWENFLNHHLQIGPIMYLGQHYFVLPIGKKRLTGISVDDVGKCALGIFKRPDDYIHRRVGIAGDILTIPQMAEKMASLFGKRMIPYEMPIEDYRKLGFEGVDIIANMFQFVHDFEQVVIGNRSFDESKQLNPELMNFDHWLAANKHRFSVK